MNVIQFGTGLTDIELMLRVREGDSEFLDLLLRRHRKPLIHFLYRMVQNTAAAEDLAQEVFLKVYRARDRYKPSANFTSWLYRIATNRAINWIRDNRHRRNWYGLDHFTVVGIATTGTPEQELLRRERLSRVRDAVDALPDRQRAAVLLHKYEELEYVEIAEALGCTVGAVRAMLNRAYSTLRQSLAA